MNTADEASISYASVVEREQSSSHAEPTLQAPSLFQRKGNQRRKNRKFGIMTANDVIEEQLSEQREKERLQKEKEEKRLIREEKKKIRQSIIKIKKEKGENLISNAPK